MTESGSTPAVCIYTKRWCGFCHAATRLFESLGVAFKEIPVDADPELRWGVSVRAGNWPTVPMIFIGDNFVGGYAEAAALHRKGKLQGLCRPDSAPSHDR
jgi:glutaredoxin 3